MCSFVLATQVFPKHHTGEAIAKDLKCIVSNYSARKKVSAVVHDQAANMELYHRILSEQEGWESILCSAHCLQLCLKEGLSIATIDRLLGAARKLVGHFHQCGGYRSTQETAKANGQPPGEACTGCGYTMEFFFTRA